MANVRLIPGNNLPLTKTVNGRTYSCAAGATIDVPDFDAQVLLCNGFVNAGGSGMVLAAVGATAARPANPSMHQTFHDTTLGYTIVFDGKVWHNPATGATV